jgi:peptidoglycan/LPS O-acetylase OafA/YrhL
MRQRGHMVFSLDVNPRLKYVPALDGLRAFAIIAVMLFHLDRDLVPGGRYGVDLFFVLSGFLITTLLLQEWAAKGSISLVAFYQRRILRLLPAALFFILIYLAINATLGDSGFNGNYPFELAVRNAFLASVYVFNWAAAFGANPGLGFLHFWSLSIEEQFYLIWPVSLLLMLKAGLEPRVTVGFTLAAFITSACVPIFLDGGLERFYYGTDFRMQGPLAGSLAAQMYVAGMVRPVTVNRIWFKSLVILALGGLSASLFYIDDTAFFLFHGGHSLYAAAAALLVLACVFHEKSALAVVLSNPILTYVGRRSYSLYLWHLLWVDWFAPHELIVHFILAFTFSFVSAELSYRLVESPALRLKSRLGKPRSETGTALADRSQAA